MSRLPSGYIWHEGKVTKSYGMSLKRKRTNGGGGYKAKRAKIPPQARGYLRQSGYYGRMTGAGAVERKFLDTDVGAGIGGVAPTMEFSNLCVVPQGDEESQRIGRKIRVKSVDFKGTLTLAPATVATSTSDNIRVMLVLDTQTNGAQFAATDLLETDSYFSFNNLANSGRFRVLKKLQYSLSAQGAAATGAAFTFGEVTRNISFHHNCDVPIEYDNSANTGAITTVRSNNLFIVTQASTGNIVTIAGDARIRYSDR